jgi:L-fuculose-phosphate aldolase
MTAEFLLRREVVRIGRMLYDREYVAATDGNISVRLGPNRLLATPSGACKGMLTAQELVVVDMQGRPTNWFGRRRCVSSEIGMHLLIYRLRPDVNAIVHAHPPTATGFAAAGIALDQPLIAEVVLALKSIPLARYATPGTNELQEALAPLVPDHDAILMANHGVVAYGSDLMRAYLNMDVVEHFAQIALVAQRLAAPNPLPQQEVSKLLRIRTKYCQVASQRANGKSWAVLDRISPRQIIRRVLSQVGLATVSVAGQVLTACYANLWS